MSHRVSVSLDDDTYAALQAAARDRGLRPTTIAGEAITAAITGHAADSTGQLDMASIVRAHEAAPPLPPAPALDADRAAWLQLDRDGNWAAHMWDAAQQLRTWYPDLAEQLRDGWHVDRFARDGTLALAVWRAELDEGDKPDPRLEHQWLAALRDFKHMLDDRQGHVGATPVAQLRPDDW